MSINKTAKLVVVQSMKELRAIVDEALTKKVVTYDVETTGLHVERGHRICGHSLAISEDFACYVPIRHQKIAGLLDVEYEPDYRNLDPVEVMAVLRPLLESEDIKKLGMNLKFERKMLSAENVILRAPKDVQALIRLTHPQLAFERGYGGGYKLKPLLEYLLDWDLPELDNLYRWLERHKSLISKRKNEWEHAYYLAPIGLVAEYSCRLDVLGPPALLQHVWPRVLENDERIKAKGQEGLRGTRVLWQQENDLIDVLAGMELRGFPVDVKYFQELAASLKKSLVEREQEIYKLVGGEFDIGSPKQLAEILFTKLKLPVLKKGKTGPSVDKEVLEFLRDKHEVAAKIGDYRLESKLLATYIEGEKGVLQHTVDNHCHCEIRSDGARSGRFSAAGPNLTNLPTSKTDDGNRIRQGFISESVLMDLLGKQQEGTEWYLVSIDLSQIEPRLTANDSGDEVWLNAFKTGQDIYRTVGGKYVFNCKPEEVTSDQRKVMKILFLGITYGKGKKSTAKDLNITVEEADRLLKRVVSGRVKVLRDKCYEQLKRTSNPRTEEGYICTIMGRMRWLYEGDGHIGLNHRIQGSAADLFKKAAIRCDSLLKHKLSSMLVPVHDEFLFKIHASELELVYDLVDCMTQFPEYNLRVPLECDVTFYGTGRWGEVAEEHHAFDMLATERAETVQAVEDMWKCAEVTDRKAHMARAFARDNSLQVQYNKALAFAEEPPVRGASCREYLNRQHRWQDLVGKIITAGLTE